MSSKRSSAKGRGSRVSSVPEEADNSAPSWVNNLNQAIDDLNVNRTSTREVALATIITTLTRHHAALALEPRCEEVIVLLQRSLAKGSSAKESYMAAQAISLYFINLGGQVDLGDQDELYQKASRALRLTAKDTADVLVKAQCLYTLALITLIAASDIDAQLTRDFIFDFLETQGDGFNTHDFSGHEMDRLLTAALRAYGLLFVASFGDGPVQPEAVWDEIEKVMPMHELFLESNDKNVRVAAGENIALMFETLRTSQLNEGEDDDDDNSYKFEAPEYYNMGSLIHTLRALSVDSSRRQSKSSRAEQKSVFRDIVKSVEEGYSPSQEIKIGTRTLLFKGWSKILLLGAFRQIIGQGLDHHFKTNDLLRQIFHWTSSSAVGSPLDSDDYSEDNSSCSTSTRSSMSKAGKLHIYNETKKIRSKRLREARGRKDVAF